MNAVLAWFVGLFNRPARPTPLPTIEVPQRPQETYAEALRILDKLEGGWSDHPADRGGATYRGVTQRTYDWYRSASGRNPRSVRDMDDVEREDLYQRFYWTPSHAAQLPRRVALAHFDAAVHHGPERAIRMLQAALEVPADGIWGALTERVSQAIVDERAILRRCLDARRAFFAAILMSDPSQSVFYDGWLNRVDRLEEMIG